MPSSGEVTELLKLWSEGEDDALDRLMPLVYDELRVLASTHLRQERADHTLQASALVNEAYLRLIDLKQVNWQNRARFFGLAARVIRNILVDHARGQMAAKRGAGARPVALDQDLMVSVGQAPELVALDDALDSLGQSYPQQARIVELRYFGGLTHREIGQALNISVARVHRGWRMARAWLYSSLNESSPNTDNLA